MRRLVKRVLSPHQRPELLGVWLLVGFTWFLLQAGPVFLHRGWIGSIPETLESVRNFGQFDQMSYLAISSNAAHGLPALSEPFTATGTLYYSAGYYLLVGLAARVSRADVIMVSNVMGMAFSLTLVVLIGSFAKAYLRRWWAPLLGLTPIVVGTLNTARYGDWFVRFNQNHTLIWPTYASTYLIHAETVALVVGGIGLALILRSTLKAPRPVILDRTVMAGFGLIGFTALIHTYVFITLAVVGVGVYGAALLTAAASPPLWRFVLIGIVAVYPIGRATAAWVGPASALLALGLPVALFVIPGARLFGARVFLPLLALLAGASVQLARVATAVIQHDGFIEFRQSTSASLAVPLGHAVVLHLPTIMLLVTVIVVPTAADSRKTMERTVAWVLALSWLLLGFNHLWGFTQEPYRFIILVNLLIVAITPVFLIRRMLEAATAPVSGVRRLVVGGTLVMVSLSLADLPVWWSQMHGFGVLERTAPEVVQGINSLLDNGQVLLDPCLDPHQIKLETGRRVIWYNPGIAFPEPLFPVERLLALRRDGTLDLEAAQAGGVTRIISRDDCSWDAQLPNVNATVLGRVEASEGTYSIWSVPSAAPAR